MIYKIVKYEVQTRLDGHWMTASFPFDEEGAFLLCRDFVENHPDDDFRVVRTETVKTVVESTLGGS